MKQIFKISIILMAMFACKRDKADFIGPAYIAAPEGFGVTGFTAPSSVDFTSASVSFNATFTSSVSWTLTITGQKSNAVHVMRGISNGFTNLVWTGKMDGVAFFKTGETKIELLEADNANSPIAKFIDKRGEGMHHIAFEVENIEAEMKRLSALGFELLSEKPKKGADNKLICFLHPKTTNGVLIELCQEIK